MLIYLRSTPGQVQMTLKFTYFSSLVVNLCVLRRMGLLYDLCAAGGPEAAAHKH